MSEILQFDDFASDAQAVRAAVIAGKFFTYKHVDGAEYKNIAEYPVDHWFTRMAELIGKPIIPKLSGFRLNIAGDMPHSWVHSDDICGTKYASVLYLNTPEQCSGGTAFWTHTALKANRLPTKDELTAQGIHADWFYTMMQREWKDLTFWEQSYLAEMKFNRLITYPTSLFHSRFPFDGFGSGPSDGRLVWVCFYDRGE